MRSVYLSKLTIRGLRASAGPELEVPIPGRFSVLVGANNAGKTTVCDAAYLGHTAVFPRLPRQSAAGLGSGTRSVDVEYSFEADPSAEGPLGRQLWAQSGITAPGTVAAWWSRGLSRDLGTIRATTLVPHDVANSVRFVYLPAWRNPLDELARREARILVELLRAQQQRLNGSRNLAGLRARASGLLETLTHDGLIAALEERIDSHLAALSAGVSRQWSYVRGQVIDDTYLARVLELMLAVLEGRDNARPLEVSGLGYVNLLHIAVTLAAIPDPAMQATSASGGSDSENPDDDTGTHHPEQSSADGSGPEGQSRDPGSPEEASAALAQARAEAESEEDSFFPAAAFHATVVIEEPEAHLHPQLQHSLVRYLRRVVAARPEIQVLMSSHATDVITACRPDELIVVRQLPDGLRVARTVAALPVGDRQTVLRMARLHMDASRSAALFAERLALVEGVTDAAVVRQFGRAWAADSDDRQSFVDALSIVAMGTRVGAWPVQFLATRGYELCTRVAVLSDSDRDFSEAPVQPAWAADHDTDVARVFHSHPTLEPSITVGNESLIATALADVRLDVPDPLTAESVHAIFRSARRGLTDRPAQAAGPGARRKGEFALAVADRLATALENGTAVIVPAHLQALFDFLYPRSIAGNDSGPADTGVSAGHADGPNGV
jgi:putative ATP-dependent endonuclease of OLD family